MYLTVFSILLTIFIGLIGIYEEKTKIMKRILAILIIIFGCVSLILSYNAQKEADLQKKIINNILSSSIPTDALWRNITQKIAKIGNERGFPQMRFSKTESFTTYDFSDDNDNRIGLLFLRNENFMYLSKFKGNELEKEIVKLFFKSSKSIPLEKAWNELADDIIHLGSAVFQVEYSLGSGFNLDSENYSIELWPINKETDEAIAGKVVLITTNDLVKFINDPKIKAGAIIADKIDSVMKN